MSFSDLMSSGKGPGVIGLLLALLVLGGFLMLGTLTLDERFQGDGKTLDSKLRQQNRDLMTFQTQLETSERKLIKISTLESQSKDLAKRKAELRIKEEAVSKALALLTQSQGELSALEQEFESHKKHYRTTVRNAAKGTKLSTLETLNGETLHDVTIRQVNALGMQVMHRDGSKRIPYKELPLAMQDHYQFDPEEMQAAAETEALIHQANDRATAAAEEAARLIAVEKQQAEQQAEAVRKGHAMAAISSRINTLSTEISSLQRDITMEAYKTISRAPLMRQQLANLEREKAELETRLRTLRASP